MSKYTLMVAELRHAAEVLDDTEFVDKYKQAADAIEELTQSNSDQRYQIEKLIYRRDHPGEA